MRHEDTMRQLYAALFILALAAAVKLLHAKVVYDDWSCAAAHCIKAKP